MKHQQALVLWFRQMAVLLQCGVSALAALEACGRQTGDPRLTRAGLVMLNELRLGRRFSEGMQAAGAPFQAVHWGALEVGERQGDIALVFRRLADLSEENARVQRRLVAALAYPLLVVSVSSLGMILLLKFLAPVLLETAHQLKTEPTPLARTLMVAGQVLEHEFLALTGIVMLALVFRWTLLRLWARRRLRLEAALFRLPWLGKVFRYGILIKICQTMGTVLGGGLPLTEALSLTLRTCGSDYYRALVLEPAVERIMTGESLLQAFQGAPGLPASFRGLLTAGEESGQLEASFEHLAHLYEMEMVSAVDSFLAALEPISIATVGLLVLVVLVSVFAPLSKLLSGV